MFSQKISCLLFRPSFSFQRLKLVLVIKDHDYQNRFLYAKFWLDAYEVRIKASVMHQKR